MGNDAASRSERTSSQDPKEPPQQRSRTGCLTCRRKRVKCDEIRPSCERCRTRMEVCEWPSAKKDGRTPFKRRREVNTCDRCRLRKIGCDGKPDGPGCQKCKNAAVSCTWAKQMTPASDDGLLSVWSLRPDTAPHHAGPTPTFSPESTTSREGNFDMTATARQTPVEPLQGSHVTPLSGTRTENTLARIHDLDELIRVYFSSVHNFAYMGFIHEVEFRSLFSRGRAPQTLVILMAANALALSGQYPNKEAGQRADEWVVPVGTSMIERALDHIGPVRLMSLALYQNYEQYRSTQTRGHLLAGLLTRMMQVLSLYNIDEKSIQPPNRHSSLITQESLRRLAWSVFMTDTLLDFGHFGMHAIDDESFTIQLPCEERPFLVGATVVTEMIIPGPLPSGHAGNLGLSAHLLRAALARRRVLHFAAKLARSVIAVDRVEEGVNQVYRQMRHLLDSLPHHLRYASAHYMVYRDQQPTLLALHAFRCIVEIAYGRLQLMATAHVPAWQSQIPAIRLHRIEHSMAMSRVFADALSHSVAIDPNLDTYAYVAIEALLFEPPRLADTGTLGVPNRELLRASIYPLLLALRHMSAYLPNAAMLHVEAVHRLVRLGFTDDLVDADVMPLFDRLSHTGRDPAEYNFYNLWVRRAQNSTAADQVDASTFGAETLLDLATESTNPSRAPTPPERIAFDLASVMPSTLATQPVTANRYNVSEQLVTGSTFTAPSTASESNTQMDWPATLGDLSLPLYTNDGTAHHTDQTTELDIWGGALPLSWTEWDTGHPWAAATDDDGGL